MAAAVQRLRLRCAPKTLLPFPQAVAIAATFAIEE